MRVHSSLYLWSFLTNWFSYSKIPRCLQIFNIIWSACSLSHTCGTASKYVSSLLTSIHLCCHSLSQITIFSCLNYCIGLWKGFLRSTFADNVIFNTIIRGTSLVVQWLRIHLPRQETRVQSLVGELRSHMPWGAAKPAATNDPDAIRNKYFFLFFKRIILVRSWYPSKGPKEVREK